METASFSLDTGKRIIAATRIVEAMSPGVNVNGSRGGNFAQMYKAKSITTITGRSGDTYGTGEVNFYKLTESGSNLTRELIDDLDEDDIKVYNSSEEEIEDDTDVMVARISGYYFAFPDC